MNGKRTTIVHLDAYARKKQRTEGSEKRSTADAIVHWLFLEAKKRALVRDGDRVEAVRRVQACFPQVNTSTSRCCFSLQTVLSLFQMPELAGSKGPARWGAKVGAEPTISDTGIQKASGTGRADKSKMSGRKLKGTEQSTRKGKSPSKIVGGEMEQERLSVNQMMLHMCSMLEVFLLAPSVTAQRCMVGKQKGTRQVVAY